MLRLIILMLIFIFPKMMFSQTGSWERIDTNYGDIHIVGKRIILHAQYHPIFSPPITRKQYSDDNGKTWIPISYKGKKALYSDDFPPNLTKIIFHPQYLLSNTTVSGLDLLWSKSIFYRSYTTGATWDTVTLPKKIYWLLGGNHIDAVTVQDSTLFLALSQANSGISGGAISYGGGFYTSKNHGITWDSLNSFSDSTIKLGEKQLAATGTTVLAINGDRTILRLSKGRAVWELSPKKLHEKDTEEYLKRLTSNRNHFFVAGYNYRLNTYPKLWRGNSDGTEWKLLVEEDEIQGIYVSDNHLIVSTKKQGVRYSTNNGDTWVSLNDGNTSIGMSSLAISSDGWVFGSGSINGVIGIFRRRLPP